MTPSPDPDLPAPDTADPPRPKLRVPRLRFQEAGAENPSPDPSPETAAAGGDGPSSADAPPRNDALPEPPSTKSGSSRTSSPAGKPPKELEEGAAKVVEGAGFAAHQFLCRDDAERYVGLYLTDEQDQAGIAGPVVSLMSRHGVTEGLEGKTDLTDLIGLGIALGVYLVKQFGRLLQARQLKAAGEPAPGFQAAAGSDDPGVQP